MALSEVVSDFERGHHGASVDHLEDRAGRGGRIDVEGNGGFGYGGVSHGHTSRVWLLVRPRLGVTSTGRGRLFFSLRDFLISQKLFHVTDEYILESHPLFYTIMFEPLVGVPVHLDGYGDCVLVHEILVYSNMQAVNQAPQKKPPENRGLAGFLSIVMLSLLYKTF